MEAIVSLQTTGLSALPWLITGCLPLTGAGWHLERNNSLVWHLIRDLWAFATWDCVNYRTAWQAVRAEHRAWAWILTRWCWDPLQDLWSVAFSSSRSVSPSTEGRMDTRGCCLCPSTASATSACSMLWQAKVSPALLGHQKSPQDAILEKHKLPQPFQFSHPSSHSSLNYIMDSI